MKTFMLFLLMAPIHVMAQKLKPVSYYLSSSKVSKEAKKFYKNLAVYKKNERKYYDDPATESLTGSILDSLQTGNKDTRPFYFYLADQNSELMDGSLQLTQAIHQYELLLKSPAYFFQYMLDNPAEQKTYMKGWYRNILIYLVQTGDCAGKFNGQEDLCIKDYKEKVMELLETSGQKVKDLALVFFENSK